MTVSEIIEALTPYTGHFPQAAMEAAIAQREEVTPHLLRALEEMAEAPEKFVSRQYMLHMFASYLLAQFREKRAYRPLTKILAAPGDIANNLFGGTTAEGLDKILASVYDGDPEPIKRLVEGGQVYEFVRGSSVDALMILVHTGQIPRQEVVDYYRDLFRGRLLREYNHVWNALANAVADLPAPELVEDLRKAYEDDLADPGYAGLESLEREARVPFENKEQSDREKLTELVTDAIGEMSRWAAFQEGDENEPIEVETVLEDEAGDMELLPSAPQFPNFEEPAGDYVPSAGIRRSGPKIGRNDPCPCGSGKKYKKCCLGK